MLLLPLKFIYDEPIIKYPFVPPIPPPPPLKAILVVNCTVSILLSTGFELIIVTG